MKQQMKKMVQKGKQQMLLAITGVLLLTAFTPYPTNAQYILDDKVSFVYVNGTSTLHDWTASVEQMKGTLQAEVEDNHLVKISSLSLSIPATSLKSNVVEEDSR